MEGWRQEVKGHLQLHRELKAFLALKKEEKGEYFICSPRQAIEAQAFCEYYTGCGYSGLHLECLQGVTDWVPCLVILGDGGAFKGYAQLEMFVSLDFALEEDCKHLFLTSFTFWPLMSCFGCITCIQQAVLSETKRNGGNDRGWCPALLPVAVISTTSKRGWR